MRNAFGKPPGVHKDQRRAIRENQFREPIVDLVPQLRARHRAEFVAWDFHRQIHVAPVSDIHNSRVRAQQPRHFFDRLDGGGETDALCADCPISASRRASDSIRWEPRLSSAMAWISSTITVETFRNICRDFSAVSRMKSDSGVVTRMCGGFLQHLCAFEHRRVAGSDRRSDGHQRNAFSLRQSGDLRQRQFQISMHVVAERFQGRNVNDLGFVRQRLARAARTSRSSRSEKRPASCPNRSARK